MTPPSLPGKPYCIRNFAKIAGINNRNLLYICTDSAHDTHNIPIMSNFVIHDEAESVASKIQGILSVNCKVIEAVNLSVLAKAPQGEAHLLTLQADTWKFINSTLSEYSYIFIIKSEEIKC